MYTVRLDNGCWSTRNAQCGGAVLVGKLELASQSCDAFPDVTLRSALFETDRTQVT